MIGNPKLILTGVLVLLATGSALAASIGTEPDPLVAAFQEAVGELGSAMGWTFVLPEDDLAADAAGMADLVQSPGRLAGLSTGQRAGLLVALADRTALDGDRPAARALYEILAGSGSAPLAAWGIYMTAGMDFDEGDYASAAGGYGRICADDGPAARRDHACAMADLAHRLAGLSLEEGDHGDSVPPTP